MDIKNKLVKEVWRSDTYFLLAKKGSMDTNHQGMRILRQLSRYAKNILDLGCGEGTRLNLLLSDKQNGTGVDISEEALEMGKKSYPRIKFIKSDLERTPLKKGSFDLVYSAYVLEHLTNPEQVIKEAIRLTSLSGHLVLIAPNYGAPNRASPPSKDSRIVKLMKGLLNDIFRLIKDKSSLDWEYVKPLADRYNYSVDWDTTIEPYIGSLLCFLKKKGLLIEQFTTCWSEELRDAKLHQKLFRLFGGLGIYPFFMWGPHLVVAARKVKDED